MSGEQGGVGSVMLTASFNAALTELVSGAGQRLFFCRGVALYQEKAVGELGGLSERPLRSCNGMRLLRYPAISCLDLSRCSSFLWRSSHPRHPSALPPRKTALADWHRPIRGLWIPPVPSPRKSRHIYDSTMLNPPALFPANKGQNLNNVRDSYRPAASLTRSIPQGVPNAEVLSLGPSHLKDVLYTAYHESGLRS